MPRSATDRTRRTVDVDVDADAVLSVLGDEYAREILEALADGPATVGELAERCAGSRVTIYRRLDDLEAVGFVRSGTKLRPDGNHCTVYRPTDRTLTVTLSADGVEATFESSTSEEGR